MIFNAHGNRIDSDIYVNVKDYGAIGDGISDDTNAIQRAIDENICVYIPSGTFLFSATINVPDCRKIVGHAGSVLKLTRIDGLLQNEWRTTYRYPYIYVGANCLIDTITVYGSDTIDYRNHNAFEIHGDNTICRNVSAYNVNYFPEEWQDSSFDDPESEGGYLPNYNITAATPGYGLFVFNANHVKIIGGRFVNNGYQGVGIENADDVLIDGCYVGNSLRTGIQLHRGSTNIKVCNCVVENQFVYKHADITFHGSIDAPISNVVISKCMCNTQTERTGVLQTVWGFENKVVISDCVFKAKKRCIYIHSRGFQKSLNMDTTRAEKWIISNNILESLNDGIKIKANDSVVSNNIVECGENKIVEDGDNVIKSANILLDNSSV